MDDKEETGLDPILCDQCGVEICDDDWYLVDDPWTKGPLTLCGDCYWEGRPEPPTRAMPPREA